MHKLGEILKRSKKRAIRQGHDYYSLTSIWKDIMDKKLAQKAHPEKIIAGKLYVGVQEPIWAQQLKLLSPTIINKINKKIGKEKITQICFKLNCSMEREQKEFKEEEPVFSRKDELYIEKFFKKNKLNNGKLKRIFVKDYKTKKKKLKSGYKECGQCGYLHIGSEGICLKCKQDIKHGKMKEIIKDLEKTPWAKAEEMGFCNEDSKEVFIMCKSVLIREKQNRLEGVTFRKIIDSSERKYFKKIAQEYVELKTGLKPYEINEEVIKNNLPRKLYGNLFDERKK